MIDGIRARGARRRVPLVVHRRLPRRDRARPRRAARVPRRRPRSTGPGSSRSRARTARRAATLDGAVDADARARAAARVRRRCRSRSPRAARDALVGRDGRGARRRRRRRRRARRPHPPRSARDRRRRAAASAGDVFARPGAIVRARRSPTSIGPDLDAKARRDRDRRDARRSRDARSASAQSALATPANFVTIARIARSRSRRCCSSATTGSTWLTVGAVVRAHLHRQPRRLARAPRRHDPLGRVPRPVADKFLVLGGLRRARRSAATSRGGRWSLIAAARGRHLAVPLVAGRRGISLPAQRLGKYKAFFQYFAVGFVLLPPTADWAAFQHVVLWLAVALTVVSGLDIVRQRLRRLAAPGDLTDTRMRRDAM